MGLPSLSMTDAVKTALFSAFALSVQACSYSETYTYYSYSYYGGSIPYTYYNYNVCDGSYCSSDLYCQSYHCSGHTCSSRLEPWAIFLIVFFSVFCCCGLLRCIIVMCKKSQNPTVIRNRDNRHLH